MRLTLSLLSMLFTTTLLVAEPAVRADYVVATTGSDDNPGTEAKPFATLARARDAVRKLNSGGPLKATGTVLVRDGTYVLKETLVFSPEDSGAPERRIVYAAYPGEKPVLSGGRAITGWKRGEGKRWVAAVPPGVAAGASRSCSLTANVRPAPACRIPTTAAALGPAALSAADRDDTPPDLLIGYTEFRTDLPGGRHANVKTRRAAVVKADGMGRRVLAEELTREAGYSTQFVGWSPDGEAARLSCDWKSEEVARWEEEHKDFRTTGQGVRHDAYPHKALGVKRKYFPRERVCPAFFLPDGGPNKVAAVAEIPPRRSGLRIHRRRGTHTTDGRGEPHPTLMRTLAARPRRDERLCQRTCPGRSRYSCVPSIAAIQKRLAHSPKGASRSVRLASGADRPGEGSCDLRVAVWRGSGGRWDGHKPSPLPWDSVTLIPFVPRPTGGPRRDITTTAVGIDGRGRRPIKASGCLGGPGPHLGVMLPGLAEVVVGVGPPRLPFGFGSPAALWLSMSQEFIDVEDLFLLEHVVEGATQFVRQRR